MTLSHSVFLSTISPHDRNIIRILSKAFLGNERMRVLIGQKKKSFHKCIQVIISFCYFMVKKWNGIFITEDQNTYLLFYRKNEYRFSTHNFLHYLYMAFFVIGIRRVAGIFNREKKVKKIRQQQVQKNNDKDYLYVWFLANKNNFLGMNGLVEVKKFLQKKSTELNLPVYIETTDERLLNIYQRAGFAFYDKIFDEAAGLTIWFGRMPVPNKTNWLNALVRNLIPFRNKLRSIN